MRNSAIAIYTGRPIEDVIAAGGSQAWVLDPTKASNCEYAVLCYNPNAEWSRNDIVHGTAYLIGRLLRIDPADDSPNRYKVVFSEHAEIDVPDAWGGWRNPIKYTTLDDLGIDPDTLSWKPTPGTKPQETRKDRGTDRFKEMIAQAYGVPTSSVEITIRL